MKPKIYPLCFLLLAGFLVLFAASCTPENDRQPETDPTAGVPELMVPHAIDQDGAAVYKNNRLHLKDYSNLLHAVSIMATVSRQSEYGHENYRPELYPEKMRERAEQWLDMVGVIDRHFNGGGMAARWIDKQTGATSDPANVDLSVYPHLVYAYHIHHRSGRFEDDELLFNRLNREATNYLVTPGRYLMNEHFGNGTFRHANGDVDHKSMSYALGGLHANAYAWIVWQKPGGQDDMGVLTKAALGHHMGHTPEQMVEIYRAVAQTLDEAWDEQRSTYDFGDGTTWRLDAAGAMIRGKKAMYDFLYMFGDDGDAETSRRIFDRTAAMLNAVAPLAEPWGMPEKIAFTEDGARAASETVNLYDWYQFLNHLGGGYGFDREREGMPMYIDRHRSDLKDLIGELSDNALLGVLDYHVDGEGRLFTAVSYDNGSVTDDRLTVSTAGMFITMAGNMYRKGSAFDRASDWDNVPDDVADRSRKLHDITFDLLDRIEQAIGTSRQ
ncbi:MAG: hypothetical protein EA363_08815 [Balneolaceae bacterium]|nr:MAG: hypothetical protein EA363_08815 [Balneolaceae bacterium]